MNVGVSVLVVAVHVVPELVVLHRLLVVGDGGRGGIGGRMDSVVDSVVRNHRGGMDSVVRNHRGSMDSVVRNHRSSMDSMVSHRVWSQGDSWSKVGGVVPGGDHDPSVADGGVVSDVTTDPGHQGPQSYGCYLNISYYW